MLNQETPLEIVEQQLTNLKNSGLDPFDAIARLKSTLFENTQPAISSFAVGAAVASAAPDGDTHGVVQPATLAKAAVAVFSDGLTPLSLAQSLKQFYGNPNDVALGVKEGYPQLTATDTGKILLDPSIYPSLSRDEVSGALLNAGYSAADTAAALAALFPLNITFTVQANQKWQSTNVNITPGMQVSVNYTGGVWTANPYTGMVNAGGNPGYIAKPGYPLPGYYEGSLIGRAGGIVFNIGTGAAVPANATGVLELIINDDLDGIYGIGFPDNSGSVTVSITSAV